MRFYPTKIRSNFACFFLLCIFLILGCSKDSDLLLDSVIDDTIVSIEEIEPEPAGETSASTEETSATETTTNETEEPGLESRTTSFSPTDDAHYQSGKGYNQNIIRLDEGHRTSYLMFDLSPIAAISGTLTGITLQFTVDSDDGSGSIDVFRGSSNNWSEENLSASNVPQIDTQVGTIVKEYEVGTTEFVTLTATEFSSELSTLILSHKNGNDLAFASKEHPSKIGPKLVVTYEVAEGTPEINVPDVEEERTSEEENSSPENEEPLAIADASPTSGGAPLVVAFTGNNSSDDTGITSFLWDFKDGATATTANPTHTYTATGVFEAVLTVTDAEGLTSTDTVTITVNETPNEGPKSIISATPITGEAPLQVSFTGSNSTDDQAVSSYSWNFGNGAQSNNANFTYTYEVPGTYNAELTVTDEHGLSDKASITITVNEKANVAPVARTSANITQGTAPLTVQFTGSASTDDKAITQYAWDFKDGATATTINPSHTFNEAGTYLVELTVSDEAGLTHKNTITITVNAPPQNQAPVAVLSANVTNGEAPLAVQFLGNSSTDDQGITNYFWNFKDGSTSTSATPLKTFNQAGSYVVDFTVTDAEGASDTKSITITVTEPVVNTPPGYYVATNGNSSNNGQSPSSPWSLEHAFAQAKSGDIVYVKAGNYGNQEILIKDYGNNNGNPVKFIGYRNTPGDITSGQGSTYKIGDGIDSSKMPLLNSSSSSGIAFEIHRPYVHLENFHINGYGVGVQSIDNARHATLKNIIVTNPGNQNNSSSYDGFGMSIRGNNSNIENCFVLNATAEAIKLFNADYSIIKNSKVYATNATNPTDYYFFLAGGTDNAIVENCRAERTQGLSHGGHGFNIKDNGAYNTIKNCTAIRTNFELTYAGVHHNTIDGGTIYGSGTSSGHWQSVMAIYGGANNNLIKGLTINDTWTAIALATFDDRTGADASLGHDNTFENITVNNTNRVLNIGGGTNYNSEALRYKFRNSSFSNFDAVAVTFYKGEDFEFSGCSFNNGNRLIARAEGVYMAYNDLDVSWINCTWTNVNFTPPN